MTKTPSTLELWNRMTSVPGGRALFSAAISMRVPYFSTVVPTVQDMRPGKCEVTAPKWFGVYNHIQTFHAIATCNLAEIAMGMLAEATVPATHRWLPKGMTVSYVAKAETGLRAVAELPEIPEFGDEGFELPVPVTIYDKHAKPVTEAVITIWITPKA
ncbi:MAG: hotdog fold domain-containing protein [Haloechinothrix sp.]